MDDSKYAEMAIEYLDEHGFQRGGFLSSSGAACAVGAIGTVKGVQFPYDDVPSDSDDDVMWNEMEKDPTVIAFAKHLVEHGDYSGFTDWMDDPVWIIADFNDRNDVDAVKAKLREFADETRTDEMRSA